MVQHQDPSATAQMNRAQLEDLLENHHAASFGWALACCRWDRTEAEEVLQTAYLKIFDESARFDGRSSFKTWLFAVIRRTAAERRRRAKIRSLAFTRWLARNPEPRTETAVVDNAAAEEEARLVRALAELPGRQREVLHLAFYGELTLAEVSHTMGLSLGSVRTHYERGKRRLRERLAAEEST